MATLPSDSAARIAEPDRDALLGALTHEVGNLLAAIRLSAHLLGVSPGDASAGEPIGRADHERLARELGSLAGRAGALLAHLRPLLGRSGSERLRMPADELLEVLEHALQDLVSVDGAKLVISKPAGLPAAGVDPEAVHRVLVTLALGAAEVCDAGSRLEVSARDEGEWLVLLFEDGGRALDRAELARPAPRSSRELGLRLADAVLRLGGGHVRVACDERGTRVEAWLPVF